MRVCAFFACEERLFSGGFQEPKTYRIATSIAARKPLALPDDHRMRRAVRLMRNLIGPASGANIPRLKYWSETGAFHCNPRNKSVASRFGERGGGSSKLG
jgi:hypothetical protein